MNLRERGLVAVVLVLLAGTGLAIVATSRPTAPTATATPAASPASDLLREGVVGTITTLDPLYATGPAEMDVDALMFRGLTKLGPDGTIEPDLAASWETSSDGLTWTFTLRNDVLWDDGQPLTADDVTFTILTLQHPDYDGPRGRAWSDVVVQRVDRFTVRFTLGTALGSFLAATRQPIVPAHLLAAIPIAQRRTASFATAPVGSGPFRFSGSAGGVVHLVRLGPPPGGPVALPSDPLASLPPGTPAATLPGLPRPFLNGIDLHTYATAADAAAAFQAGDLDVVDDLPPALTTGLAALPGVRRVVYPTTVLTVVVFNLRSATSPFRDVRVRRAMLAAIDRPGLVEAVLGGAGTVSDVPIPPSSLLHDPDAAAAQAHDVSAAATLLAAAGWKRSSGAWLAPGASAADRLQVVTLDAATNPILDAVAHRVVADWATLGVAADVIGLSAAELFEGRLLPHEFDVAVINISLGDDPDLYPLLASGQAALGGANLAGYQSAKLDDLLSAAQGPGDLKARQARFATLGTTLAGELPFLTLYFAERVDLVRDRLVGPAPRELTTGSDRFWDVLTWRLAGTAAP
ncbi:MAG: peptide ABC transporter substrate-binding protein [Candidatus Limnocylindrales bacterium]